MEDNLLFFNQFPRLFEVQLGHSILNRPSQDSIFYISSNSNSGELDLILDCKTVHIFAYSSIREQSNNRSRRRLKTESETGERRQKLRTLGGAIHSAKISRNFGWKLNGSVRSNRKSFEKLVPLLRWTTFSGRTDRKFWLNGSRPPFCIRYVRSNYPLLPATGNSRWLNFNASCQQAVNQCFQQVIRDIPYRDEFLNLSL